ncbi:type II toxin-antitoxin system VapC family toxin [Natronoflexus pectinivorans]|uniref:Putative nucleic acid-binding protein n=1 Tax=Natronoflexus pectinivorans TaxID=682526 RepID=A0A4R2GNW3_9BACT|nr:PIN domain-containing protein [Natronoflexus pectinivorans]TCO11015.1 putative nucleic acid-binding protein [Natronoflexus pectinivorans]
MKKLFVDTNIVIDLLSRRVPFFEEAAELFSLADKKQVELSVSSLTIANTSYALLRQMDSNKAKSVLRKLRLILKVLPLDDKIIGLALNDETFSDFEDALQYFTAIEDEQELIITRNLKDFKNSKLPTMTAKQFIETLE